MAQQVTREGDAQVALVAVLRPQPEDMLQLLPLVSSELHAAQLLPGLAQPAGMGKGNLQRGAACILESHLMHMEQRLR